MSKRIIPESVLFRTSASTDVQCSGGIVKVAGLRVVSKKDITAVIQNKYRAEVKQVVNVANVSYVPTGGTLYQVAVYDPLRTEASYTQAPKVYSYRTSNDLSVEGSTASLQREYIHGKIITKINNVTTINRATAATLTGGAGIAITDVGGYYPIFAQNMTNIKGVNKVYTIRNADGSGFAPNNFSIATAAVIGQGSGAYLLAQVPITSFVFNNLISGILDAPPVTTDNIPLPPITGQNYDAFVITSLKAVPAVAVGGQQAYQDRVQTIYVDNGTGAATTNLTGFIAFEEEMLRVLFDTYQDDPSAIFDFFDSALIASATYPTTGVAVTTTDNVVMAVESSNNDFTWYINPIGAHTVITPIVGTAGISLILDATTQEGYELSAPNLTQCPKQAVVGKAEMSFFGKLNIGGAIGTTSFKSLSFGLRKKGVYAVDQTAYEAASIATAALGVPLDTGVAPVINTITGPGAAGALTNTSTTIAPAINAILDLYITVDINGVTKFYLNGVDRTPAAGYTFAAGTILMPFASFRLGAGADATPSLSTAGFVSSIWRS